MYKIKIAGMKSASDAATWLQKQSYNWEMSLESMAIKPVYVFSFELKEAASHFALKWT